MKKALVAVVMILLLVSLCACSVASNSFMSRAQVNSLTKRYPNPQAQLTLKYKLGGNDFEVTFTYNLLLDKAPIAVTRFVQLANEGAYNDTVVDKFDSTYLYAVMGRYGQNQDSRYYNLRYDDVTFAGEFKQNGYREPKGGYAQFQMYSLAMFHDNRSGEKFDSANGTLLLALSADTLNSDNYAVFAEFASMKVVTNGETVREYSTPNGLLFDHMKKFTTSSTQIYDPTGTTSVSGSILKAASNTDITITVAILGDYDWSKLPTIR